LQDNLGRAQPIIAVHQKLAIKLAAGSGGSKPELVFLRSRHDRRIASEAKSAHPGHRTQNGAQIAPGKKLLELRTDLADLVQTLRQGVPLPVIEIEGQCRKT